ncbi:DOT1-domain-containing protein [Hyaloscypha variabilis F]|uniref:Histone-lysine N-methyltransferase, H3 lysine-79 specific n=1 Tax=Hyaloscypha variabilis (strain UAMH 11265 / GT02V1 / F) TaxID=1149755 RepID=A0A2J6RSF9_HYAVF|nr:DOT1-domain-containing protein [Hyaloscypha variabilis F]
MSFFKSKTFNLPKATPTIRTERVPDSKKPAPLPSKVTSATSSHARRSEASPSRTAYSTARSSPATPPSDGHGSSRLKPGKRKASRQKSPVQQHLSSDSEDEESVEAPAESYKRQKASRKIDMTRQLRSKQAFSEADGGVFEMIHAADVSSVSKKSKLATIVPTENVTVELKYPSSSQRERYNLVFGNDNINPTEEILEIAKIVADVYLAEEQKDAFCNPTSGLIRQLEKAKNLLSSTRDITNKVLLDGFKKAVENYNLTIEGLLEEGALATNLDAMHHLPLRMVHYILQQVYDRAVSPKVELLKHYENGTDNIYGELEKPFISKVLAKVGLTSDQVFVDLGSGVGNVVLQAALEFGCESWGCEMMENACKLAEAQEKEFAARCRLWGIQTGKVQLERGDFLVNQEILKTIKRADVILVNNQAFTPQLNQNLIHLFLDLRDGCKIISLKQFGVDQISSRKANDPANVLDYTELEYFSGSVSWTNANGHYFIAEKDSKRLEGFA